MVNPTPTIILISSTMLFRYLQHIYNYLTHAHAVMTSNPALLERLQGLQPPTGSEKAVSENGEGVDGMRGGASSQRLRRSLDLKRTRLNSIHQNDHYAVNM